ncbi:hypothetical protein DFJ74DRAFT_642094 [Hyaloraphidium curvatum]|nr:hypothetical protein DFJ74DRAFT_642094 [Hyaloraphidium curvatum]
MLATVPALLAAIGLSRPPGPVGPFATACAGILVGYYVSIVSFALPHHRVLAPRRFKSPADPQLAGTPAVIAWYWARAITDRAALLRHCPPKDDYAGMEELFVPEEGPKLADAAAVRSSECPCPQCFGLFAGNGWLLVGWFILHHFVVVSGILVAMLCLSFWDLWGSPGSPLLSRPWVAACFAIHVVGIVATNFVAAARENHVMVLAQAQIIRRVQIRASRAACDAFVRECAERVRMSITDRGTSPGFGELVPQPKPATEACNGLKATNEEQLGGPSPDWALPQLYARVASDVKQYGRSRTLYTVYLHLPLGTAGISLLAALLCSFSFGGSCFPAWGFAIPFLGVFVAAGNLADMAVINAASAAVADVYREAGDAVASLAADLPSGPGSAVLAADLERHRMELDRIADALLRGTAKAKFLGFAVTGASLINIAVAVITVGATLFRAFGLRLQLGTYCTPVE